MILIAEIKYKWLIFAIERHFKNKAFLIGANFNTSLSEEYDDMILYPITKYREFYICLYLGFFTLILGFKIKLK